MQILGIGPLEFLLILVVMILVLGPKGMLQAARESGKFIRKVVRSPIWREIVGTSHEIRDLPNKIIKEAGIEEEMEELRRSTQSGLNTYTKSISPLSTVNKPIAEKPIIKPSVENVKPSKTGKEKSSRPNKTKKDSVQ